MFTLILKFLTDLIYKLLSSLHSNEVIYLKLFRVSGAGIENGGFGMRLHSFLFVTEAQTVFKVV